MLHVESKPVYGPDNEARSSHVCLPERSGGVLSSSRAQHGSQYPEQSHFAGQFAGRSEMTPCGFLIELSDIDALEQACEHRRESCSVSALEIHLEILEEEHAELLQEGASDFALANNQLQVARALIALQRGKKAWRVARSLFDGFIAGGHLELAADACQVLFEAKQKQSRVALGQGIWLAVTCPIDPELTVDLLCHFADDIALDLTDAAVAAAAALFLVDVRARGKEREELMFFASQLLSAVARKHDNIDSPQALDGWMEQLGLKEPEVFLVRLRRIVDGLVGDDWWFDRRRIYERLPFP